MSHVFGQSHEQFVEMILQKFFLEQAEDRVQRVEMIAELLCEMPFPTQSEAEEASYRLEAFANLYGPNNSKDIQIRTKVFRYGDKDWGVECDCRQAGGSWRKIGFNHRPEIAQKQRRILEARGLGWEFYSERVILFCEDNIEL